MNFGAPEILIVLAIVLLLFGAKKLPELARGLGQAQKEFKQGSREGFKAEDDVDAVPKPTTPAEPKPTETPT